MVNIDLGYHRYIDEKNKEITLLWSTLTLDIINILMKKKRSNLALNNIDNGYHKYIDEKNKEITLDWSTQSNLLVYFNLSHIRGLHSCIKALLSLVCFLKCWQAPLHEFGQNPCLGYGHWTFLNKSSIELLWKHSTHPFVGDHWLCNENGCHLKEHGSITKYMRYCIHIEIVHAWRKGFEVNLKPN